MKKWMKISPKYYANNNKNKNGFCAPIPQLISPKNQRNINKNTK